MASSWFNTLGSVLSRRNKKKLVTEKPLSRFSRYLALERLEDRLNMDNQISFVGGVLTATIQDNARDIVVSLNGGNITFTDQTVGGSTQWLGSGGVPSATVQNTNPGTNPTSVTVNLGSASYQAGTLTGISIVSNSTNNNYSFGLNDTVNTIQAIRASGTGYALNQFVYIGTPAQNPGSTGFVPAVAQVTAIGGGGTILGLSVVNVGSDYTNNGTGTLANALSLVPVNTTGAGSGGTGGGVSVTLNASSPLDFSTLGATNVGFSFTVPNAGTVNSLNYNDYIRTKGDGGIAISAGAGTGNVTGLSSIAINTPGSGFTQAPVVTFSPVVSVPATATSYLGITDGTITGALSGVPNVGGGGTGYTIGDVLQLRDTQVGGNGTGFNRFIVVTNVNPANGAVTNFNQTVIPNSVLGVVVTNNGTGYRTTTANDSGAPTPTVTFGLNSANNVAERARGLAYLQITQNGASPFNWTTPTNMVVTSNSNQVQLVENASSTNLIPGGSSYNSGTTVLFNNGALNSVQIDSGGTGYPVSQTFAVTISNGTSTVNGKATTNGAGVITSISLDSPGSGLGFVNGTSYTVTGSTFTTQASVFANRNGQSVLTSVGLVAGGSGAGYAVNDTVTIVNGGAGTNATGTVTAVNAGAITAITLNTQGTGFTNGNSYNITPITGAGTGGSVTGYVAVGAEASATISPTGIITGLTKTVNGVGYTTAPTISFGSAGSGAGAVASAVLGTGATAGTVTGFVYSQNYDASATVNYKMQNLSINNTGTAVATSTLTADRVTGATVTSNGSNYVPNAKIPITFSGGGGTGATGFATSNGSGNIVNGSITITSSGSGYTSAPSITFGGGRGAILTSGTGYNTGDIVELGENPNPTSLALPGTANIGGGQVLSITPSATQGSGYTIAPTVTLTNNPADTTGSGATAIAVLGTGANAGKVVSYTIVTPGTGYTAPPIVTLTTINSPATRAQYSVVATGGQITSLTPFNNVFGSGYVRTSGLFVIPTGTSTGVGGTVDTIGTIETMTLNTTDPNFLNNGNYKDLSSLNIYQGLANSSAALTSGVNTGATFNALGLVRRVSMTYNGANYTTTPSVTFVSPQVSGGVSTTVGAVNATGTALLSQGSSSGDSYSLLTAMNVTGGTGTDASFSATGFISRVVVNTPGNYTTGTPTVSFSSGGGGTGATATASIGTQLGSYVNLNPSSLATVVGGTASALVTSGAGNITIEALNEFSFVSIDQPISTTGTGSIRLNAGYRPAEGYAVRLNADLITNTGNINFSTAANAQAGATPPSPVGLSSTSAVLLAGNSVNLTSTGGGSVFFSSTLDATAAQTLQINSSGNFTVFGNIGTVGNGLGDIILGGQLGGNGLNSVWFNGSLIAESITVNNANTYVRNGSINPGLGTTFNGILIVGPQIYNNSVSSRPALDLRTVNNGNITMQDSIFVTTANNTSGEIFFTTSNSGSLNLLKGLSTTSNLTISGVTSINLGNNVAGVGANNITLGVAGSNGLTINNPLNLIGNVTMALAATKPLSINSTINGGNDLRVSAQGGNINITGDVGGVTPLRNIILDSSASSLTFSGTTVRAGGLSTNGNFVSGNIDLSIPTTQVFNGVTTLLLQASGNIILNAMNLSGTANMQIDNNNTGILELRGSITNVNSQFLQQRATGGTAGASGAVAGVKIGNVSGAGAVSITGTNTGGTSIQFQGSEIGRVTKILSLVSGGTGYSQGDILSISGVSAAGTVAATVTVQSVNGSGGIISLSTVNNPLDNFGYNINTLTGISLVGGTGTGAVVNAYGVSDTFVDLLSSTTVSTLSGGNITFNGRLQSTNTKSFTVSSVSGNLTFQDDVGLADGGRASFPLASFTASTGGIGRVVFSNESNGVGTSGNITITGNSTISNSSVFTAGPGNISFSGDLSGTTVNASDLTFRNTGSISVGSLGQGTNGTLQDVLIDGNATSFATSVASGSNGGILATSFKTGSNIVVQGPITVVGQQTYGNVAGTNDVSLVATGNITMDTQQISSVGNFSLTSSTGSISIAQTTASGAASFSHAGGSLTFKGNLQANTFSELASSGSVNLGVSGGSGFAMTIASGPVIFNSVVNLSDSSTINNNNVVRFKQSLRNGVATQKNLTINNATGVVFESNVGDGVATNRLGSILITSNALASLQTSGTIFNAGSLTVNSGTTAVAGAIDLSSAIVDLNTSAGLTLSTRGGTSSITLGTVNMNSAGPVFLNSTTGDIVNLYGNISNAAGFTQAGSVRINVGQAADVTLTTAGASGFNFAGNLQLVRNLTMTTASGIQLDGTIDSDSAVNLRVLSLNSTNNGNIQISKGVGDLGATLGNGLQSFTASFGTGLLTLSDSTADTTAVINTAGGITIAGNLALGEASNQLVGGNGAINVTGNITGSTNNLKISTTGAISLTGALGIGTALNPLGDIEVNLSASQLSITGQVFAKTIKTTAQVSGAINITGAQTITEEVLLNSIGALTVGAITSATKNISLTSTGSTVTVGALTALNATNGGITLSHANDLTLNGSIQGLTFTESGTGRIFVNNALTIQVTGTGSDVTLNNQLLLKNNLIINSNDDVTFLNSVDTDASVTSKNLTITIDSASTATSKAVTFNGNVGTTSGVVLGSIIITGANKVEAGTFNVSAASMDATAAGPISIKGTQTYNGASGLTLTSNGASGDIDVGVITTSNAGGVTFNNKNGLNLLGNISSNGIVSQTTVAGGTAITRIGDPNSSATLSIQTTNALTSLPISIVSNIEILRNVSIKTAGSGGITLGTAGTTNTSIQTSTAGDGQLALDVQTTAGGTININSDLGVNSRELGSVNIVTTGPINIASRNIITANTNGQIYTGNVTISNSLNLSSSSAAIQFNGAINGTNSEVQNLSVSNSTGTFNVTGNIGNIFRLGDISLNNLQSVTLGTNSTNVLNAKSLTSTGVVGNIAVNSTQNYSTGVNLGASVNVTTGGITVTNGDATLNAGGNLFVNAISTTGGTGNISLTHGSKLTLANDVSSVGTFVITSGGSSSIEVGTLAGTVGNAAIDILVTKGNFVFSRNVTLFEPTTIKTLGASSTGKDITFGNLLDSVTAVVPGKNLSLDTTGVVTFSSAVGSQQRLGAITINASGNYLAGLVANGSITASSFNSGLVQANISITADQNYNSALGLNLTTVTSSTLPGDITLGLVTTTNGGVVTIRNSGLLSLNSSVTADGAFSQLAGIAGPGGGTASPAVAIGPVTGSAVTVKSNTAGVSFASVVNLLQNTTIQAGGAGNTVSFASNINSTATRSLAVTNTLGRTDFLGMVGGTNALSNINVNSQTININGGGVSTSTPSGQVYTGAVGLGSGTQILTASNSGSLTFTGDINGPGNLTLRTGGAISVTGAVGIANAFNSSPLGDMVIDTQSPTSLTITGKVTASSLSVSSTTPVNGNISIVSDQSYSGTGGLVLRTSGLGSITVGNITNSASSSTVSFQHAGNLNLQGDIFDSGSFSQNGVGSGSVIVGRTGVTSNLQVGVGSVAFNKNVTLNGNLVMQTAAAGAGITFGQNLNSAGPANGDLTINSTGTLTFSKSVGNIVALGVIDASQSFLTGISATDTTGVIKATSFASGTVAGNIDILAPQTYTGGSTALGKNALSLTTVNAGSNITLNAITTNAVGGGDVNILNSALLQLQDTVTLSGFFNQLNNDSGATVKLGGTNSAFVLTTGGKNIGFQAPIELVQNSSLSTGATGLGNVTIGNDVNSLVVTSTSTQRVLTIANANGNTSFAGSLGSRANSQLGSLSVTSSQISFDKTGTSVGSPQDVVTLGSVGQSYTGPVFLNAETRMNGSSVGNLTFSTTVDSGAFSAQSLALNNFQSVQLNGNIGGNVALSSLNILSNATTLNAALVNTTGANGQVYDTSLSFGVAAPATVNLSAATGPVDFRNTVNISSKNLVVTADEIEIGVNASISSNSSNITLRPGSLFTPVSVGGNSPASGVLDLTASELARLNDGFASITVGRGDSNVLLEITGALNSGQIHDPYIFTSGGELKISNPVAATSDATLNFVNPNTATGKISLNNTVTSEGKAITFSGVVAIGGSGGQVATTINSPNGADIIFLGNNPVSGTSLLTLDSGSVGLITANGIFNMSGGITITNSGGATFNQAVTTGPIIISSTTTGKDVSFSGALNATSLNTSTGAFNLKILSGGNISGATTLTNTGITTLGDQSTDALTFAGGLTATSASLLNLAGTIATTNNPLTVGNSVLTTSTTLRSGGGIITTGSVTGGAGTKLSLQNNSATGAVNLTGNVTVNQIETFSGNYAVNLTGANNQISSGTSTTFLNTGGVTFGSSSSNISTFTNGLTATASPVTLAGTVATTNSAMNLGVVNLAADGTVKSGSGTITVASVSGANRKLSLQDNTLNSRGLVVVNGNVTIGQIETFAQNYGVSLLGSNVAVASATTFNNTGVTTFGDGGVDAITFTGGLTAKAGPVILNSTLATTNTLFDIGSVTLAGNSTLKSGTGTITVGSITDGVNSFALDLQDSSGALSQGSVIFSGDVTIFALNTAAKTYAVSFQNNTTIDSSTIFNNLAGVSFGRNASSLTTFTNGVTAIAGTGNFVLAGTLKTAGQPINLGNSGASLNLVDSTTIDSGNSSSATIKIDSLITTNNRSLTLSSGSTSGATIAINAIDSTAGGLTIANAGGQVTFAGNVGAATGSGLITITNSQQGVEFQGSLFGSNVNIVNTAASKTIKFGGNLTLTGSILTSLNNYNVDILGTTNTIGAVTSFNNLGNVNLNSSSGSTTFTNGFGAAFPAAVNLNGTIIANGAVTISKPVNIVGNTTATFNSGTNTISGAIAGASSLTMNGTGTLSLTGNSPYSGTINANAGNVAVNANFANANASVGAAGKISGIGTINNLNANGIVSPGNSPGTLTVGTAVLGTAGVSQASYNVELNGPSAGQFDQLKVNSSASLANAVLNITAGGNLQVGQQFQIVSGPVTGTFANAVSSISTGNVTFSVTYNSSGVLLTVTSVSPTPTPTPTPTPSPTPTPTPTPTPSPTPAPTPTPPAPTPSPTPTPTPTPTGPYVLFAVGADAGGGPEVRVNFTDGTSLSFFAYDMAYRGGVRVAMGDLNGDGSNEIITGTGPGGGPNVRVFTVSKSGVAMVANFFAFEPQFMGGVYVAAGNLNGDVSGSGNGIADLIVSAGPGGGPRVISYAGGANYVNLNNQLCDYFVYSPFFTGGVSVAAGNIVGAPNSADELITGAGPGGGPHVRAFQLSNTNTPNSVIEYMAFDPAIRNGIYVGAGDLDNDGYDEIFTGTNSAPNLPSMVNVRYGNGNQALVYPFGEFTGGARVGVAKDNNNNQYMVVGAGPGGGPLVQIYNRNLIAIDSLFAFPLNFTGGVFVNTTIS